MKIQNTTFGNFPQSARIDRLNVVIKPEAGRDGVVGFFSGRVM